MEGRSIGIKLQTHPIRIYELSVQVKLAGESALLNKPIFLVEVDGGKIIHAHTQVDLANRPTLPGPLDEIREHLAPDPEIPVFAQDRHPKLTGMLEARTLARAEGQRSCNFPCG